MISVTNKLRILESLDALDQSQSEKVLAYIKELVNPREEIYHQQVKREAMKEIRQALNHNRRLGLSL
jgi:tellurite resistance protein